MSPEDYIDSIIMMLPGDRIDFYKNPDYASLQKEVIRYANKVNDALGFYPIDIDMPILAMLQGFNFAILFLALIFRIVVALFISISILLIYSLLSVSVEAKSFDIGVS
jgi:hypothetical protein